MEFTTLTYQFQINNNIDYIFNNLLLSSEYYQWIQAFRDDVITEGKLELNEQIIFKDTNNNGIVTKVTQLEQNKIIELSYIGELINSQLKLDETGFEQYYFRKINQNQTGIKIILFIPTNYAKQIDSMWHNAIKLIQQVFNAKKKDV